MTPLQTGVLVLLGRVVSAASAASATPATIRKSPARRILFISFQTLVTDLLDRSGGAAKTMRRRGGCEGASLPRARATSETWVPRSNASVQAWPDAPTRPPELPTAPGRGLRSRAIGLNCARRLAQRLHGKLRR